MSERKVTIKDVAKHAGVGVGTVSSVINRSRNVSAEARKKVEESIKTLGFKPDELARSFRTQRTKTIAFFINDIANTSFSTMAKGIYEELEKHGLHLTIYNTGNNRMEDKILEAVQLRKYDGIILSMQNERHAPLIAWLKTSPVPVVLLDRELPGVQADAILSDFYSGIRQATEHLIALGHRRIGLITAANDFRPARETLRAYADAMKLAGLPVAPDWIKRGEFSVEFGSRSAAELAAGGVTAIIAGSNQLLVGSVEALREARIDIPRQLSLIGFEDSDFTRLFNPSITAVKRPLINIGKQMANMLLQRLNYPSGTSIKERIELIVPVSFIARESCAPPAERK